MKKRNKQWHWLETFPTQAAVLAEWEKACGDEFERASYFLVPTKEQSRSHPCTHKFPCECEHRVVVHSATDIVACCECETGGCPRIRLQPKDLVIHEFDVIKFGDRVRSAFGFQAPFNSSIPVRFPKIGTYGAVSVPVLFYIPHDEPNFLHELEGLFVRKVHPFLLVTPTLGHCGERIDGALKRHGCGIIPLSRVATLGERGKILVTDSFQAVMRELEKRMTESNGLVKGFERMEAILQGTYELKKENEELRSLHGKGFFNFALKVDGEDFRAFAVIMALGNRKAAADFLNVPHRSFYDRVNKWHSRSREYQLMGRYIDWRKRSDRHLEMKLDASLQSGDGGENPENPETLRAVLEELKDRDLDSKDYPEIMRQILEALQIQNAANWNKVRQEVVEIITEELPQ